ncbi:hypothetical protein KY084_11330 [Stakelama sp. CBK3Z-3]|uniref:Uncharacterized protein n=1 Tax=Stakelama flava TaxID=2860338 RepID=A0ABS6XML5_9SPHN|nr:hypothetical protein [Stakelama flava]MBW4331458.1 hypothetical protein [Stakelama flava]
MNAIALHARPDARWKYIALALALAVLAAEAALPALPAPGLWAVKRYAAPDMSLLLPFSVLLAIGAVAALVLEMAGRNAARHDPLRSGALVALALALTLPAAHFVLAAAALPLSIARVTRSRDLLTPLLIAAALVAVLAGGPHWGAPALAWATLRLIRSGPREAANDNRHGMLLNPIDWLRLGRIHLRYR